MYCYAEARFTPSSDTGVYSDSRRERGKHDSPIDPLNNNEASLKIFIHYGEGSTKGDLISGRLTIEVLTRAFQCYCFTLIHICNEL